MLKGLSRLGLLEWLDTDPGKFYFRLIPSALLFFAMALEWRHLPNDSRYFYPIAVVFICSAERAGRHSLALSGVAGSAIALDARRDRVSFYYQCGDLFALGGDLRAVLPIANARRR